MDNTAVSTAAPTGVSRRRVVQGMAWATPAIVLATAVPAAASSDTGSCDSTKNGTLATVTAGTWGVGSGGPIRQSSSLSSNQRGAVQTGWTPSTSGDLNSWNLGGGTGNSGAAGFQSMSDNTLVAEEDRRGNVNNPEAAWTTLTATYTFEATANTIYTVLFKTRMQHGFHRADCSARQSVDLAASQNGSSTHLIGVSVNHQGSDLPAGNRTDAAMSAAGYQLQLPSGQTTSGEASSDDFTEWTRSYTALHDGTVTLTFTFTLEGVYAEGEQIGNDTGDSINVNSWTKQVSDDIWVSLPVVTQYDCV